MEIKAITELGKGTPEQIIRKMEELDQPLPDQELIGEIRQILAEL